MMKLPRDDTPLPSFIKMLELVFSKIHRYTQCTRWGRGRLKRQSLFHYGNLQVNESEKSRGLLLAALLRNYDGKNYARFSLMIFNNYSLPFIIQLSVKHNAVKSVSSPTIIWRKNKRTIYCLSFTTFKKGNCEKDITRNFWYMYRIMCSFKTKIFHPTRKSILFSETRDVMIWLMVRTREIYAWVIYKVCCSFRKHFNSVNLPLQSDYMSEYNKALCKFLKYIILSSRQNIQYLCGGATKPLLHFQQCENLCKCCSDESFSFNNIFEDLIVNVNLQFSAKTNPCLNLMKNDAQNISLWYIFKFSTTHFYRLGRWININTVLRERKE